jgi:hypothetical protein
LLSRLRGISLAPVAITEWELWACARALVGQYGAGAAIYAAMRADALLFDGEREDAAIWCRIATRIDQLEAGTAGLLH